MPVVMDKGESLGSGYETKILYMRRNPAGAIPLEYIMESLILAQNKRWRRVLSMQVER